MAMAPLPRGTLAMTTPWWPAPAFPFPLMLAAIVFSGTMVSSWADGVGLYSLQHTQVPGTNLPNCNARVPVPPMNGTFTALKLDPAKMPTDEPLTTDVGWNFHMKGDSCRYPLWGRTETADCLRGNWFVVIGASSANIWMMQLANIIVPGAVSTQRDNFNIDGVWTQMIDIIIENGQVTYRKIALDAERKATHDRKGAHNEDRDRRVLKEKFAQISQAPAYSDTAIRITHFNAEYWDDVDLAVEALESDTAWREADLALTVQVGLWYVSSLSCQTWDKWCATRPKYEGIGQPKMVQEFKSGMENSMNLLDGFCAPGGRTGQRGCAITSVDHCSWMKDSIWYDIYHVFNTTARMHSTPYLRFIDIWTLTSTLNVNCQGEHQSPMSTVWTWQVLLGGFCDQSLAANDPIAVFDGALCTSPSLEHECKDYKKQGFKFDWECALAKPCQLLPNPPSIFAEDQGCDAYMAKTGCSWTESWNCPDQPAGKQGHTSNDGSLGYTCCCALNLWNSTAVASFAGAWQSQGKVQARGVASWPTATGLAITAGAALALVAAAAMVRLANRGTSTLHFMYGRELDRKASSSLDFADIE